MAGCDVDRVSTEGDSHVMVRLHYVTKESLLQPLQGEEFNHKTAKVEQETRVDISARGFWNRGQKLFFDLHVFNLLAPS